MRFLVVYQDFSKEARELVDRLGVTDVRILLARKGERAPSDEVIAVLEAHPQAPTAVCQVHRKYQKCIKNLVDVQYAPKRFRPDDQQLREWLRPTEEAEEQFARPSCTMINASSRAEHLVLADGALDKADELADHRWRFANLSADLLARYAEGADLGPLREWKQNHGVEFAANGQVRYKYEVSGNGRQISGVTEWHLKEGDHTTRASAARVYFDRVDVGGHVKIVVFYVGPHPRDGTYSVYVDCDTK